MTTISIRDEEEYAIVTKMGTVKGTGRKLSDLINCVTPKDITPELKDMYVSLFRSIEDSDDLRVGIVIGQVLSKLNELINEAN